ncbi:bifunctional glutamate--cysteine ligase GshA/glutathione synthetase GshB [Aerococcus kribbianus]|uniref:Glutathione biosynthesis bifunctional protein GshAB n=1 Tax=Aerococcus kribbianus TaxID=2999064 RepID=A0A9X3JF45_9LACT|nr:MULTISPECIES: bifunctional glutamate--cysteine ligase GshA/glutathione synthetase GshB [unclassified Aerococcus]MCZ0716692.1 bifunctional glutamate--cysteine ligase GshA/glutathione synthetase GshB [Aerococcus sp. YH-aer221]MCZ0724980.1 bifunctional glutamate--cysteine ligase GshA/glutathione synthetase GshB [Aerococcus sp. YH-aer222]
MQGLQSFISADGMGQLFQQSTVGLEREGHRIASDGKLALTPHPPKIDGAATSFFIQRDFAESQLELVTPPVHDTSELMQWLQAIHEVAVRSCDHDERLWPFSAPPALPSDEAIAVANLEKAEDIAYREYLVKVYGKKLQMISGIHYNFELSDDFIQAWYQANDSRQSYQSFKSNFYLRLARNFLRYQWLVVYLFGASPAAHDSFYNKLSDKFDHPIRSIRNSHLGYINKDDVTYSYANLEEYARQLTANVDEGRLVAEKEFYSNVRLRGGKTAWELVDHGIDYLEFRLFDIQPQAPYGIWAEDIDFMRYFILYLIWMDEDSNMDAVRLGNKIKTAVAEEDAFSRTAYYEEGREILAGMRQMLVAIGGPKSVYGILDKMLDRLDHPELTPAAKFYKKAPDNKTYQIMGEEIAAKNAEDIRRYPYLLGGFTDMELSTQLLMADAIQGGYYIDILDRDQQIIRLTYKDHQEIIKNANITSKDTYISHYVMENKEVTKLLLEEAGYQVPKSQTYKHLDQAKADISRFVNRPLVVKPKSTNMGIGISIFKHGGKEADLQAALELAFDKDDTVLVEEYVDGTEYRFYVMDGKTQAVLLRVGANVRGDGESTIAQLVDEKNQDKLRGNDHRSPLEIIKQGPEEAQTLKNQGLDFDSVLAKGELAYLRDNSNISTGGDSIDMTELMHPSYKEIAQEMAKALGANISGLDLIIADYEEAATDKNYACIEANFNPMMMMHIYPAKGQGQPLNKRLLQSLFPEKTHYTKEG